MMDEQSKPERTKHNTCANDEMLIDAALQRESNWDRATTLMPNCVESNYFDEGRVDTIQKCDWRGMGSKTEAEVGTAARVDLA